AISALLSAGMTQLISCSKDAGSPAGPQKELTGKLFGTVHEALKGAPISGATVIVGNRQTTTAQDGSFEMLGLPIGNAQLKITAAAFEPFEQAISIVPGENKQEVLMATQTLFPYKVGSDSFVVYIPPFVDTLRGVLFMIGGQGTPDRTVGGSLALIRGSP